MRWLWPIPVAGFVIYPYLKRWTWLCHLWLGAVDGLAPLGAWAAITGTLTLKQGSKTAASAKYALAAARHGKHVMCEKPVTIDAAQAFLAQDLFDEFLDLAAPFADQAHHVGDFEVSSTWSQ